MASPLGQIKTVTIEVPEEKAESLKTMASISVAALKIIAEASKKPGIEAKLFLAKTLGQI